MALPTSQVSIPAAQRAAARLGCAETFAIIDDKRSISLRRIWIAEQVDLNSYRLAEELGQGRIGDEMNDPFALVYLDACKCNVQWLTIEPGCPDGPKEIRDMFGKIVVHRILSLRDTYDQGGPLSEVALMAKQEGEVIWTTVHDDQGVQIAEAPVRIAKRVEEKDDNGVIERVVFKLRPDGDKLEIDDSQSQAAQAFNAAVGQMPAAQGRVAQAVMGLRLTTFVFDGDPANASGSHATDEDDMLRLWHANDVKQDDDEDEDEDD